MRTVRIAELKARLSEHLRAVRRGHALVVTDRDTPIARLVPYRSEGDLLSIREPAGAFPSLQRVPLPKAVKLGVDAVELLLEERQTER